MAIRRFSAEDRSNPERIAESRITDLSLQALLELTDFSEEEVDKLADLKVGEVLKVGRDEDLHFKRTA